MDILTTIVEKVVEYAVEPIVRQAGYIIHCKSNLDTLQNSVEELRLARGRVHTDIVAAERKGERIYSDVVCWMTNVDEITGKVDGLLKDEHQGKMKCLHGFCPNLLIRHQLSRKSTKLVGVVVDLNGKGDFPSISHGSHAEEAFLASTKGNEAFDSRISTVKRIIDELRNPNTNKIGVYGIGGVGKTTLMEEVVRQVIKDKLFDDVVMVLDVKENADTGRIQNEIAEQLGMDSKDQNQSVAGKARSICGRIKDKKTLIVLDDIWKFIDLKVVGLPNVTTCKILLTSRSLEVLSNEMGTQKDFSLAVLDDKESWSLFESKAGDVVRDLEIRTVATQVAKKCGGLPVLVVTIASALRKSTLGEWKDALRRLKKFEKKGPSERAFFALEWSYDQLDDEELKPLFLLCGIIAWRNSILLDDLLKHAVGLGLFKDVDTLEEARNALLSLVTKLKGYCLVLDDNDETSIRMHDLVHDVAHHIAFRDQHVLSVAYGGELKEWPNKDFFDKCSRISFKSNNIPTLPEVLECKELEMFHLDYEDDGSSLKIPDNFFHN